MQELKVKELIELLMGLSTEEQEAPIYVNYSREKTSFSVDGIVIEKDLSPTSESPLWLRLDISRE